MKWGNEFIDLGCQMINKRPKSWCFVLLIVFWQGKDKIVNLYKGRWPLLPSVSLWWLGDLLNWSFTFRLKAGVTLHWIMSYKHYAMFLGLTELASIKSKQTPNVWVGISECLRCLLCNGKKSNPLHKSSFRWTTKDLSWSLGAHVSPWGLHPLAGEWFGF